ncbi:MAG: hypothetical protein IJX05_05725, partial [Clostridia bacterium]|nr:hypothetical protein [Clostridia bacterium]
LGGEVVFVVIVSIFIGWMQSLVSTDTEVEFSLEALGNWWNWMVIFAQTLLSIFVINMIINHGYDERKNRIKSRLCRTLKTNELRVDLIYARKLHNKLDEVAINLTESYRHACYLRHAHKINARIEWGDLEPLLNEGDAAKKTEIRKSLIHQFCIDGESAKKFNKIIDKIISGAYKDYERITSEELYNKGVIEYEQNDSIKDNRKGFRARLLIKDAIRFVIFAAAMLIVITELIMEFSIAAAFSHAIYIISAVLKGIAAMNRYCNYTISVFERRNSIFEKELGLSEIWKPEEEKEEKEEKE